MGEFFTIIVFARFSQGLNDLGDYFSPSAVGNHATKWYWLAVGRRELAYC
jgi:hypothetical protein